MFIKWKILRDVGVDISFIHILGMMLRRTLKRDLVKAIIENHINEVGLSLDRLELHYMMGGNVLRVVDALQAMNELGISYKTEVLLMVDISHVNVVDFVEDFKKARIKNPNISFDEYTKVHFSDKQKERIQ